MASLPPDHPPNLPTTPLPSLPKGALTRLSLPVERPSACQVILHQALLHTLIHRVLLDEGSVWTGYLGGHLFYDGQTHFYSLDSILQEGHRTDPSQTAFPERALAYFTTDPFPHGPSPPPSLPISLQEKAPWIISLSLRIPSPASYLTCSLSFTRPAQSTPLPYALAHVPSTRSSFASSLRDLLHRARLLSSSSSLSYKRFLQGLLAQEIPETLRELHRSNQDSDMDSHARHAKLACRLTLLTAAIAAPDTPFPVRATFSRGSNGKKHESDPEPDTPTDRKQPDKGAMTPEKALPLLLQGLLKNSLISKSASAPKSSQIDLGSRSRWASGGEEEAEWILRHPASSALRPSPHPPTAQISGVPLWMGTGGSHGLIGHAASFPPSSSAIPGKGATGGGRRKSSAQPSSTSSQTSIPGNPAYSTLGGGGGGGGGGSMTLGGPSLPASGRGRGKKTGGGPGSTTTPPSMPLSGPMTTSSTIPEAVGGSRKRGRTVGAEAQPDLPSSYDTQAAMSARSMVYGPTSAPSSRTIPYTSSSSSSTSDSSSTPTSPHMVQGPSPPSTTSPSFPSHLVGQVHPVSGQVPPSHPMGQVPPPHPMTQVHPHVMGQVHPMGHQLHHHPHTVGHVHPQHHPMYGQAAGYPPQGLMQAGTPSSHPAYAMYHSSSSSSSTPSSPSPASTTHVTEGSTSSTPSTSSPTLTSSTSTSSPTTSSYPAYHPGHPPPPPSPAMASQNPGMMPHSMTYGGGGGKEMGAFSPGTAEHTTGHPSETYASPSVPDPSSPGPSGPLSHPHPHPPQPPTYSSYPSSTHPYYYHPHPGYSSSSPSSSSSSSSASSSSSHPATSTASSSHPSTSTPAPPTSSSTASPLPGLGPRGGEDKPPLPGLGPRGGDDQSQAPPPPSLPGLGHSSRPPPPNR
ncbi:MAG: hypothetical protein DHS80DRAFT_21019 [Piptocephalis tieghemiana]|nr:MAG: hypothetical protein DHS80DRAFT_21019 [Piptocephalis tieghemiana]